MKNRLHIRTDGDPSIGLGHIVRCTALAHMIRDLFDICFYIVRPHASILEMLSEAHFRTVELFDEQEFFDSLDEGEVAILDGYHFDTAYQQKVKDCGIFLVCIDDLHDRSFVAHAIINHAPGVDGKDYDCERSTRLLLGPEYALLRPGFIEVAKTRRNNSEVGNNVFVNFGGADKRNLTVETAKVIIDISPEHELTLVTGSAYTHKHEMNELIHRHPGKIIHLHNLSESEMIKVMIGSGLAVVPASGILFEVLACNVPCVSGYYVQNQQDIYIGFKKKGVFYDAGQFQTTRIKEAISAALTSSPSCQLLRQREVIDGLSPVRFQNFFKQVLSDAV